MTIALVVALAALAQIAYAGSRIDVPLLALSFGAPTYVVGILMSLYSLPPMLLAVYAGRLMDRVGTRRPMIAGAVLMAASLLLASFVQQMWFLYILAVSIGVAQNLFSIALFTLIGSLGAPKDRTINASWLSLGFSIGHFFGPLIAGLAIDRAGHGPAFALLTIFPLACLAVLSRTRHSQPRRPEAVRGAQRRRFTEILAHPKTRGALIAGAVVSMGWDVFSFVTPVYGTAIGLSASEIGTITAVFGLAAFVVRPLLPAILRRTSEWPVILFALLFSGALFLAFPFMTSAAVLVLLAFLLGLALGGAQPMVTALLFHHVPAERHGEVVGLRATMMHGLHTVLPLLFGAVGSTFGMTPIFWSVATVLLGCGYGVQRHWGRP